MSFCCCLYCDGERGRCYEMREVYKLRRNVRCIHICGRRKGGGRMRCIKGGERRICVKGEREVNKGEGGGGVKGRYVRGGGERGCIKERE